MLCWIKGEGVVTRGRCGPVIAYQTVAIIPTSNPASPQSEADRYLRVGCRLGIHGRLRITKKDQASTHEKVSDPSYAN
jgi:hypothetical protein